MSLCTCKYSATWAGVMTSLGVADGCFNTHPVGLTWGIEQLCPYEIVLLDGSKNIRDAALDSSWIHAYADSLQSTPPYLSANQSIERLFAPDRRSV